jgi:hypothetical protein
MDNKEQKKRFVKQVKERSTVDAVKNVDGRDPQINEVRQKAQDAHVRETNPAVDDAHDRANVAHDFADFANKNANSRILNASDTVSGGHIRNGSIVHDHVRSRSLGDDRLASTFSKPGHTHSYSPLGHTHSYSPLSHTHEGVYAPTSHGHSCSDALSGASQHNHSISFTPFIKYAKAARRRMLELRAEIGKLVETTTSPEIALLARGIEQSFALQMDYTGINAYEREEILNCTHEACKEWSEFYRTVYGVDEYAEGDRENYLDYGPVRMDPYEGIAPAGGAQV